MAVPSIVTRPWMVTLGIALAVPDLSNSTVAEDEAPPEAGVFHGVHGQIQGDVVRPEGFVQSLMLDQNLQGVHRWVSAVVVSEVDNTVADSFGGTELPVVIVAGDDVYIVALSHATRWRQEGRHKLLFRNRSRNHTWMKAHFIWSPKSFDLKSKITK